MTIVVATVIIVPAVVLGSELVENSAPVISAIQEFFSQGPLIVPRWLGRVPIVGPELVQYMAEHPIDGSALAEHLRDVIGPAQRFIISTARTIGSGLLELVLSVAIAFFLYRDGIYIARRLQRSLERLGGARAIHLLGVAGATIKGVVYGVLGTALAQAALAMAGFLVLQIQGALFLGFLTFFMSLLPMGPPLVWVPVVVWLAAHDRIIAAILLALWGLFAISGVDNLLKPYLISRAGKLPFILVLLGAFGGVVAFGLIGVFLGPILLAMGFNLVLEWSGAAHLDSKPVSEAPPSE